ncbi:MAG: acetyltransferase [Lutibacter sp.]|nr:acetyltransferase [Lutibacter sp.]
MNKILSLLGAGGHAKVVIEAAKLSGFLVDFLYDDDPLKSDTNYGDNKVIGNIDVNFTGSLIIAIGNNKIRKLLFTRISKANWQIIAHPTAIISKDVFIGKGSVIMAGAIIQPGTRIGKHCIINTGVCVDHDCIIGDFVHIAPNCSLAGGVSVGEGTFIGIGSCIVPNITIGSWTNVGAGSVIIKDQPDNCTTLGVPAKPIKFNNEQK